jgi:hypothetical protein
LSRFTSSARLPAGQDVQQLTDGQAAAGAEGHRLAEHGQGAGHDDLVARLGELTAAERSEVADGTPHRFQDVAHPPDVRVLPADHDRQ